jgi:hypothetical protein
MLRRALSVAFLAALVLSGAAVPARAHTAARPEISAEHAALVPPARTELRLARSDGRVPAPAIGLLALLPVPPAMPQPRWRALAPTHASASLSPITSPAHGARAPPA